MTFPETDPSANTQLRPPASIDLDVLPNAVTAASRPALIVYRSRLHRRKITRGLSRIHGTGQFPAVMTVADPVVALEPLRGNIPVQHAVSAPASVPAFTVASEQPSWRSPLAAALADIESIRLPLPTRLPSTPPAGLDRAIEIDQRKNTDAAHGRPIFPLRGCAGEGNRRNRLAALGGAPAIHLRR